MYKTYRVREYTFTNTPQVLCEDGTWFKFRSGEVFGEQELYDLAIEFGFTCFPWGKLGLSAYSGRCEMGIGIDVVYGIPTWATMYLYYGEKEGLTNEDIQMIDDYVKRLDENAMRLIEPLPNSYDSFNHFPAFGKASSTEDWIVEVI